jgi:hypothetical protein
MTWSIDCYRRVILLCSVLCLYGSCEIQFRTKSFHLWLLCEKKTGLTRSILPLCVAAVYVGSSYENQQQIATINMRRGMLSLVFYVHLCGILCLYIAQLGAFCIAVSMFVEYSYKRNSRWQHCLERSAITKQAKQNKTRGLSPRENYTDRTTAACRRS